MRAPTLPVIMSHFPSFSAYTKLREMVRYLMYMIGLDGSFYGAHSLWIGGATAMFKKKATPLQIKTQGRWGSDIYMIYIERCRLQSMALSRAACSTSVEPEETDFLGVDIWRRTSDAGACSDG